ncbi:MAG: amino acid-binding protein [Proteobacteria bacterium]|nr:amino acid-binding protein [Pseudomonadota bacterium]
MTTTLRISVFCPDRVGLISAITGKLFDLGANLGDTAFAVLGTGAEFTTVCDLPEGTSKDEVEEQLNSLEELKEADVTVSLFQLQPIHGPMADITHRITIRGGDNPGLVARLSEVFVEFDANIVRLNSEKIPGGTGDQYLIHISAWIPESCAEACLATITNTASALQMRCHAEKFKADGT